MSSGEEVDTLKVYWDHFFKAETGTYEKSTWLDLFLAEFLIRVNEGANPKELIHFCPVSGVVTLVGCELLCGIHRVTSSINSHYSVSMACLDTSGSFGNNTTNAENGGNVEAKTDDAKTQSSSLFTRINAQSSEEILKKYLLGGVAWRCLMLLQALGVEGLSCCRQLSSVLIWLFGELSTVNPSQQVQSSRVPSPCAHLPPTRLPIYQLFSHKIWSKHTPSTAIVSKVNSAATSDRGSVTGRSRRPSQNKLDVENKPKRKTIKHSDSSESGDTNDDLQILNRSLTIKVTAPNDDFEYFNSSIRSSNDYPNESVYDPFYSPKKIKPKAENHMTEKHKAIINSEITTFEFILLITNLLQELCKAESSLSGAEGSQISMQCINFSLRNLCSLQFSSLPQANESSVDGAKIKVALTELLIVSLDKVLVHSDLCAKLINNGILPMLLRILEDVISKCKNRAKDIELMESRDLLKFVFGIAYSITAFFHCLLMQCRTVDKLREFTDQFKLYGDCLKGGLLVECIELMIRLPGENREEIAILLKKLIESIGKLICGMKRVRSEVIHSAACPRTRHKVCRQRVAAGMHHHHDIMGEASTGLPMSSTCCISVLYGTLTSLLTDDEVTAESMLRNKILRVMLNCGVCCCFSPGFLMESIVRLMLTHNNVAPLCLQLLEHTVYGDLGASVLVPKVTDQLPCSICEPCDEKKEFRKYCPHGVSAVERKSVCSFLIHYNSLLQLDNHNNLLHATVSHLLRVTPKCRMEMKYELLFSVIYPTFIVSKHRYIIRLEETAYFLTVSCLNIFASLLNTVSFAEQFIQKGGLSYVLELVSLSEFSSQCCSILEIAIIVEIFKLMKENSELTYFREISSLSSVQMLFKSLTDVTEKFHKIYKLKLPAEKYEELCDLSGEKEFLGIPEVEAKKMSLPQQIKTTFGSNEDSDCPNDYSKTLKNVWNFWKTCASLCLYSPMFREYMVSENVFLDSYSLLKISLYYLCNCEYGAIEMRILIKMVEALLTMQFSVSDVTQARSKDTSCKLVREALSSAGAVFEGGGGLRALCEALIRVATAHPSRHHSMPRVAHGKVPPLVCPPGGSSAEGSSSEESVSAPYASEHSDPTPTTPDEGYEADVEVSKLDIPLSYRVRKMSESMASVTHTSGIQSPSDELMGSECAEYTKSGELAHPELCIIVVDILTQLISKLLKSKSSVEGNGDGECEGIEEESVSAMKRVGGQLARACCARLAGAVGRGSAGAAPPLLLHRLLARAAAAPDLLARRDLHLEDLQRSILELIHVLASQSISASELGAFLKLFTSERPPLKMLLTSLQRLVTAASCNTPDCILTFPVDIDNREGIETLSEELSHLVVNSATSQSHLAESYARKLQDAHMRAGIKSPWSCGAVRCGIEGAGWAPWLQGFALVLWLHAQPHATPHHRNEHNWEDKDEFQNDSSDAESKKKKVPPRKESPSEPSHVMSVGHESLMFELWLDTATGVFTLRLSRPEASCNRVVSEARVASAMPPRAWNCIALNLTETVHKRHIFIQVTLFVNGYECDTVSLPVQGILVRKVTPTSVVVGHAGRRPPAGVYHLSHATVYRAPLLTACTALHLTAHGPDNACLVRCESPNYPLILTPNVLDSNIDWDQVYEISTSTLRDLHDNLLLTFGAHAPNIMNLYHQTVALPTVFAGRVPGGGGLMSMPAVGPPPPPAAGAPIPETLFPTWRGSPLPSRHRGLAPALYLLGGPDMLLFLYARVVELKGTAEEQALALGVLLRACRVDNRLYAMLHSEDTLDMLLTVFAAPDCKATHHLLEVVINEACSAPIVASCGDSVVVGGRGDAVLLEPALLVLLTRAWRHLDTKEIRWEVDVGGGGGSGGKRVERGCCWALFLRCVGELLGHTHPRRAFNHYQMTRVDLLTHLLLACKERFLNSECGPLDQSTSSTLVEVVRGLMGTPPLLHRVALLCDFLLLMHQASDTFVTHSRANFYFLLTSETQEMSEFASSSKRKPSKRSKRKPELDIPSVSSTSTEDNEGLNLKDMGHKEEDRMDSSIESTKQLKGLINMQIKEGRKHHMSSTSENSDTTAGLSVAVAEHCLEEMEGEEGRLKMEADVPPSDACMQPDDLTEYIVVDVEDVNHTTVEMYTGGIYHQRRVRAGALPGWCACEGLLLLLRDAVAVLPEYALKQAVCGPISAETLIVLGNHKQACVRAALVRVVAALQRRAPPDLARKLRHHHYYIHLANQISLYDGSWELATACAALLTKCDVPLEDQLDDDIWVDMSEESIQRSPPVLALLPACLRDVPLAHNITLIVRRIIDKASLKMLNEVSVAEVVVRCVRAMGQMADVSFEGRELLIEDLHELLNRIALKALAQHHTMQSVCELHYMLSYVEMTAEEGGARRAARDAQVALYVAQLDYLEERLHTTFTASTRYANYFTTVLSSAVSLGGESASRLERSEVSSRHLATATRALHFLTSLPPTEPLGADALLMDRLLSTLLTAVGGSGGERARWWAGVGSGAEWVAPLQELVWWAAAPTPSVRPAQPHLLRALYHAPPTVVHMLTPPDPSAQRKLAVYVLSMIGRIHADAECGPAPVELAITDWARGWALASQAALPDRLDAHALPAEAQRHAHADYTRRLAHAATQRPHIAKVVFGKEALSAKVTETAMGVTRGVVEAQNGERKAFMEHLRREHAMHSHNAARWQRLIDAHTHQQAVWHDPDSYPVSWQLDATEGPGRVRVRMRRAHLHIAPRFLKPNERYKTELCKRPPPLRSVVGGRLGRGARGGLVARLQLNETVSYMARVICVTVARETGGELLLTDRCIHFVPEEAEESEGGEWCEGSEEGREAQSWPLEEVQQVATRRWCLQERALEMFLGCGRAILLAFATQQERGAFLKALDDAHLPATIEPDSLHEAMSQWRSGSITNWEYLMRLNGLAGRSYNDLMQYPVLPFVIADYTSRILDLTDPKSFRDLSKPMAVQNKNREQHYINVYHDLKAARREGCSPLLSRQPHHYASLYSNSGGVLHYLVRVPPFTTQFLNYQDNNFDMPDRTFHSLATTWRLITNDSPTDVKELIPELFYLPELFHNSEGLNLGVRQCGLGVDSVELPPWAADARLFTLVHRQALEAPLVTDALPHWIDLVFGYKQTGQPAIDAINVFPACTYYGFDPLALEDEVDRTAAAAMVRTYGQVPRQLLRTPHPQRQPDLVLHHRDQEVVWDGVVGASWGRYCGSPALPAPEVAAKRACAGAAALHALPNPRAVAVANRATALMVLHGEPTTNSQGKEGQRSGLALVSWGHSDGIVRLKRRRDARPDLLLHIPPLDQITKVTSSCSSGGCPFPLLVGFASGRVLGVRARALPGAPPRVRTRQLHAHRHPITDMYLCPRAGLLATTSSDGLIVLWDLNTLSYIRTLPNRDMIPVTHVTISATLCDVATVHDATAPPSAQSTPPSDADAYEKDAMYKYKSLIRVHTVNASFVGSVRVSEAVTCIVYSGAAEGVSANCVGAGLATGGVRLYSAWDLRALAHIPPPHPHPHATPLLSLCYGSDSQVLYGCYADGVVVAWEAAGRGRGAPPRIHPAHALL